jgi:hypothetical protein
MKRRLTVALIALISVTLPLWAGLFDGGGDTVFDPAVYGQALLEVSELIKNYEQLKAMYELEIANLKMVPVNMPIRYRTLGAAWYGLQLPFDRFGNLAAWLQVVNSGGSGLGGYGGASVTLQPYGAAISQLAPDEQKRVASAYATSELADGSNVQSMETVGMLRGNSPAVDKAIAALEQDSLSLDPAMNTEIAVLNKINAAAIASLRSTRDTNRVLLSTLEEQVVDSKRKRDAEASEVNAAIARIEFGPEAKAEHTATLAQSLQSFRWK